jgi:RNA polymerase sigma-70 factor (ECF subfamily)
LKAYNEDVVKHLISGCRRNDREAQKLLYKHFYAYGMSICLRYSSDRDEASSILNDGFMSVYQNIKKFSQDRPFKPWFRRIIINTSINHFKRSLRRAKITSLDDAGEVIIQETSTSSMGYAEVIDMIQKLPIGYRTIFNLYVIEGYKHEEIAEMLGISVGTSKSNLFKAKDKLRKILQQHLETDYGRTG